jgi:hypothetical protein
VAVNSFKVLSKHYLGGTEDNDVKTGIFLSSIRKIMIKN